MSESLYAAIGGQAVVESVVRDFYQMVCYDEQLRDYFDEMDLESLRTHQTEFLSMVMGGPTDYSGRKMREAHAELDISQADFVVLVDYLERALTQNGVGETQTAEILAAVATYEDAVLDR
jgi:hemoglobin